MCKKLIVLILSLYGMGALADRSIKIATDRTPAHLETLFKMFEKDTGIKVEPIYLKNGLVNRVDSNPRESDLIIVKNLFLLEQFRMKGYLRSLKKVSDSIKGVSGSYWGPDDRYVSLSSRGRVIYYSYDKKRVDSSSFLNSYFDLADPKWKGRICMRSGYHNYNISLFAQLAADFGKPKVADFIGKLSKNLARPPKGNDRAQVKGILDGKCDLAIANHYYYGIMLGIPEQKPWATATRMYFPNQGQKGTYLLRSGIGATKNMRREKEGNQLITWFLSEKAQSWFAQSLHSLPVKDGTSISKVNLEHSSPKQDGTLSGSHAILPFKLRVVPLEKVENLRSWVVQKLNEVNFDQT